MSTLTEGAEIIKRLFLYLDEWDTFCFELSVICFICVIIS